MARNRIGLNIDDLDIYSNFFRSFDKDVKEFTEKALIDSKEFVTSKLEKDTIAPNYPAQGDYESKQQILRNSIDKELSVEWDGNTAEIKVGYDFAKSGLVSVFMMYGTPHHNPAKKIKNDIYGSKTMREVKEVQKEALAEFLGVDSFYL